MYKISGCYPRQFFIIVKKQFSPFLINILQPFLSLIFKENRYHHLYMVEKTTKLEGKCSICYSPVKHTTQYAFIT